MIQIIHIEQRIWDNSILHHTYNHSITMQNYAVFEKISELLLKNYYLNLAKIQKMVLLNKLFE
jgi:hypothetical protein